MVGTLAGSMLHGVAIGTLIGAGVGVAGGAIIGGAVTDWSAEGIVEGMMIGFGDRNYINKWTGAKSGSHIIVRNGNILHKLHFRPWMN